jgi:hypothetical protein
MPRGSPQVSQGEHRGFSKNAFLFTWKLFRHCIIVKTTLCEDRYGAFLAFLTPESGIRDEDPESYVRERRKIFGIKKLTFFDADPGYFCPWFRDPELKNLDPGSGIDIPDPQHCSRPATLPAPHAYTSPTFNSNQLFTTFLEDSPAH